eukprot:scaffold16159_cov125-Skeletonema_dohrnii-CCMP3373.AAC.1
MEPRSCWHFNRCTLFPTSKLHWTLRVDGNEVLMALQPLHTTFYIDIGEASIIANIEDVS